MQSPEVIPTFIHRRSAISRAVHQVNVTIVCKTERNYQTSMLPTFSDVESGAPRGDRFVRRSRRQAISLSSSAGDGGAALAFDAPATVRLQFRAAGDESIRHRRRSTRRRPVSPRPRRSSREAVPGAVRMGELGVRHVDVGQFLTTGAPESCADRFCPSLYDTRTLP